MHDHIGSFIAHSRQEWRTWLEHHHKDEDAVWLVFKKKSKGGTLLYDDIVEEALCFGWIDSIAGKVDDVYTKLYISKRKPTSVWARTNKVRDEALRKKGLMTHVGEESIAIAIQNGLWDALNASDALILTPALQEILQTDPHLQHTYEQKTDSQKRIILEQVYRVKDEKKQREKFRMLVGVLH